MKPKKYNQREMAHYKLHFVNLLSNGVKYATFNEAIYDQPVLCGIADKLKTSELELLVIRIESIS